MVARAGDGHDVASFRLFFTQNDAMLSWNTSILWNTIFYGIPVFYRILNPVQYKTCKSIPVEYNKTDNLVFRPPQVCDAVVISHHAPRLLRSMRLLLGAQ
jgi:hypothetical protein